MEDQDLYDRIDEDEEMSDSEKREAYNAELDNEEADRKWEESY